MIKLEKITAAEWIAIQRHKEKHNISTNAGAVRHMIAKVGEINAIMDAMFPECETKKNLKK
jgi:hypothetical protein